MTAFDRSPCGTVCACGSIFASRPASAIISTMRSRATKRSRPSTAAIRPVMIVVALEAIEKGDIVFQKDFGLRVQHIDLAGAFGLVPLADLEVVEVVGRRDLDRARAFLGIGVFVRHDRDQATDKRQPNLPSDQMPVALVIGMDRDRGVAEHGFRPRRGDRHPLVRLLAPRSRPPDSRSNKGGRSDFGRGPSPAPPR